MIAIADLLEGGTRAVGLESMGSVSGMGRSFPPAYFLIYCMKGGVLL